MGPLTDPFHHVTAGQGVRAPGSVKPCQSGLLHERPHVREPAILEALQDNTLTARHLVDFIEGEDQHPPVLTHRGAHIGAGGNGHANPRLGVGIDIQHLLALARRSQHLVLGHDKTVPGRRAYDQLATRFMDEQLDDFVALLEIDHETHRLAMPAASRELIAFQSEELPVRREDDELVGRRSTHGPLETVAMLEIELREILGMAFERADPALLGENDRDRLLLDQRLLDIDLDGGSIRELRAPPAELGLLGIGLACGLDLGCNTLPLQVFRLQQRL